MFMFWKMFLSLLFSGSWIQTGNKEFGDVRLKGSRPGEGDRRQSDICGEQAGHKDKWFSMDFNRFLSFLHMQDMRWSTVNVLVLDYITDQTSSWKTKMSWLSSDAWFRCQMTWILKISK